MRQPVLAVLKGNKPDRFPFIPRMDFWYLGRGCIRTMPAELGGMSLPDMHMQIGLGQEVV